MILSAHYSTCQTSNRTETRELKQAPGRGQKLFATATAHLYFSAKLEATLENPTTRTSPITIELPPGLENMGRDPPDLSGAIGG